MTHYIFIVPCNYGCLSEINYYYYYLEKGEVHDENVYDLK